MLCGNYDLWDDDGTISNLRYTIFGDLGFASATDVYKKEHSNWGYKPSSRIKNGVEDKSMGVSVRLDRGGSDNYQFLTTTGFNSAAQDDYMNPGGQLVKPFFMKIPLAIPYAFEVRGVRKGLYFPEDQKSAADGKTVEEKGQTGETLAYFPVDKSLATKWSYGSDAASSGTRIVLNCNPSRKWTAYQEFHLLVHRCAYERERPLDKDRNGSFRYLHWFTPSGTYDVDGKHTMKHTTYEEQFEKQVVNVDGYNGPYNPFLYHSNGPVTVWSKKPASAQQVVDGDTGLGQQGQGAWENSRIVTLEHFQRVDEFPRFGDLPSENRFRCFTKKFNGEWTRRRFSTRNMGGFAQFRISGIPADELLPSMEGGNLNISSSGLGLCPLLQSAADFWRSGEAEARLLCFTPGPLTYSNGPSRRTRDSNQMPSSVNVPRYKPNPEDEEPSYWKQNFGSVYIETDPVVGYMYPALEMAVTGGQEDLSGNSVPLRTAICSAHVKGGFYMPEQDSGRKVLRAVASAQQTGSAERRVISWRFTDSDESPLPLHRLTTRMARMLGGAVTSDQGDPLSNFPDFTRMYTISQALLQDPRQLPDSVTRVLLQYFLFSCALKQSSNELPAAFYETVFSKNISFSERRKGLPSDSLPWVSGFFDPKDDTNVLYEYFLRHGKAIGATSDGLEGIITSAIVQVPSRNCERFLKEWVCCDRAEAVSGSKRDPRWARYLRSSPFYPYLSHQGLCPCLYSEVPSLDGVNWPAGMEDRVDDKALDTYFGKNLPWWKSLFYEKAKEKDPSTSDVDAAVQWRAVTKEFQCFKDWCNIGRGDEETTLPPGRRRQNNMTSVQEASYAKNCGNPNLKAFLLNVCSVKTGTIDQEGSNEVNIVQNCSAKLIIDEEDKTGSENTGGGVDVSNSNTVSDGGTINIDDGKDGNGGNGGDGGDGGSGDGGGGGDGGDGGDGTGTGEGSELTEAEILQLSPLEDTFGFPTGFVRLLSSITNTALRKSFIDFFKRNESEVVAEDKELAEELLALWKADREEEGEGESSPSSSEEGRGQSAEDLVAWLNAKKAEANSLEDVVNSTGKDFYLILAIVLGGIALLLLIPIIIFRSSRTKKRFIGPVVTCVLSAILSTIFAILYREYIE